MSVLVTGAAGFRGGHLTGLLQAGSRRYRSISGVSTMAEAQL
jgi:nucleoside-diphosphate-sugar epimerase